jgi:hypothetical protein
MVSEPTQRERARPLLDGVAAFAEKKGAGWLRTRAAHLLGQIKTDPASPISMSISLAPA